jgi:hypothetical protein
VAGQYALLADRMLEDRALTHAQALPV